MEKETHISSSVKLVQVYKGEHLNSDEPLDGDEVDVLSEIVKNELNHIEGNQTEKEYKDNYFKLLES